MLVILEIAYALDKSISKVEEAILKALGNDATWIVMRIFTAPEFIWPVAELCSEDWISVSRWNQLLVHVAGGSGFCAVVRGTGNRAEKNIGRFKFLILNLTVRIPSISQPEKSTRIEMLLIQILIQALRIYSASIPGIHSLICQQAFIVKRCGYLFLFLWSIISSYFPGARSIQRLFDCSEQ